MPVPQYMTPKHLTPPGNDEERINATLDFSALRLKSDHTINQHN